MTDYSVGDTAVRLVIRVSDFRKTNKETKPSVLTSTLTSAPKYGEKGVYIMEDVEESVPRLSRTVDSDYRFDRSPLCPHNPSDFGCDPAFRELGTL